MADESTTRRRRTSTAVPHSGAVPPIPTLDSKSGAGPRAPFNDPMPIQPPDSEPRSPSLLQPELDPAPGDEGRETEA